MRTFLSLIFVVLFVFTFSHTQAQVAESTSLYDLPEGTEFTIKKSFEIPAGAKSILLDDGKGKICSCQFFTSEAKEQGQLYHTNYSLSLKTVSVKGLFDGSQMHVARIYFKNTSDYFKLKCYTRDLLVEHLSDYLNVGTVDSVAREN